MSEASTLVKLALAQTVTEWGSSRWAEVHRCRRAQYVKYVLGVTRRRAEVIDPEDEPEPIYFDVGILTHACFTFVELVTLANRHELAHEWRTVISAAREGSAGPRYTEESCDEAERLAEAYWLRYGLENAGWPLACEIIAVEKFLEAPPSWGFPYTTRADLIVRLIGGEIAVIDHKTRGSALPGAPTQRNRSGDLRKRAFYARALTTKPQFLGVCALVQYHYALKDPPAIWLNAIVKTATPDFGRIYAPFTQDQIDRWLDAQRSTPVEDFENPVPNYSACAPEIGSPCWLFDYCHGGPEIRERKFQIGA